MSSALNSSPLVTGLSEVMLSIALGAGRMFVEQDSIFFRLALM
ncbi:hypothetical protein [Pseudoalteromonas sp. XI10]|nr:hypothetical protein [Pseudoalteromonas sp. XI10]